MSRIFDESSEMIFLSIDNEKTENERFLATTYAHTIEDDVEEDVIWGKYVRLCSIVPVPLNPNADKNR
jgi:hypothetical protein